VNNPSNPQPKRHVNYPTFTTTNFNTKKVIEIDNTLVSNDLLDKQFVCNLSACKGACCVEGDSGAPLEEEECSLLEDVYDKVKPYMTPEGVEQIEEQGNFVFDSDGDLSTPLVNNSQCAYVYKDDTGITKCAVEKAYLNKEISFRKPISCYLFPVRLKQYKSFTAVNVQLIDICSPACDLGEKLKVPVYKFLEQPLIQRFGQEWYNALSAVDEAGILHADNSKDPKDPKNSIDKNS
jgi:hypothetical protein